MEVLLQFSCLSLNPAGQLDKGSAGAPVRQEDKNLGGGRHLASPPTSFN